MSSGRTARVKKASTRVIGGAIYIELVNACYNLKTKQTVVTSAAGSRVLKHVEVHFRTLPAMVQEFNHYQPASYLMEHRIEYSKESRDAEIGPLDRFEKSFIAANAFLPVQLTDKSRIRGRYVTSGYRCRKHVRPH
jgi:hypothetical protein